jgi:ribosomal protein S18 acetylase RimI-like enzyme
MEIRIYQEPDEQAVIALWNRLLEPRAPHNDPALNIRKKLEVDRDLFFVATMDERVVGTVMGGYDGHRGWIYSVAVDPEYQRYGIGSALLRHVEAALLQRGCLKINLQVRSTNTEVIAFYERLGFEVEEIVSMGKRLYSGDLHET